MHRSIGQSSSAPGELASPLLPAIYAAHLVQLVKHWGIEPFALLDGSSLAPAELEAAGARIEPAVFWSLYQRARALTGEPGLGFWYGTLLKLPSHGNVGFAAIAAATLRDALLVSERFISLRSPYFSLRFTEHQDGAALVLSTALPGRALCAPLTEILFTALVQMGRTLLGRQVLGHFELTYPEPAYFHRFRELWPGTVRFECAQNRICFSADLLEEPLNMADPLAARQAVSECERELDTLFGRGLMLSSLRRRLAARVRGFPSLTELAREHRMSVRTLKRRLADHGTSFQCLLDDLRRERALALLEDESLSIEQIGDLLGYSDAANFTRAFRRWLGCSPSQWRERHPRQRRALAPLRATGFAPNI